MLDSWGHRGRGIVIAATVLAILSAASVPVAASAELPPAFPDGEWHGVSVYGGQITKPEVWAAGGGDISFDMTVSDATVDDGTLDVALSEVAVSDTGTSDLLLGGTLQLGGTAALVEFSGPVTMTGTASSGGFTVPVDFTGPTDGTMSPSFVTCNQVTGDLATQARNIQGAAGFATGVTGLFVALRTGGSTGAGDAVFKQYLSLSDAMVDALGVPLTPDQVIELTQQYEVLAAKFAAIGSCGTLPPGFESGLSDKMIGALFQDLLQKALDNPDAYSAQALLSLLGSGLRMGAVGSSVPGSGAYQDFAQNLLVEFETTLESKLQAAAAAGDTQTILDILVGAQQYGLDALADEAKKLLAEAG